MHAPSAAFASLAAVILLAGNPASGAICHSPQELCFSPDGRLLATSDRSAGQLVLIDSHSQKILHSVAVHGRPAAITWSQDGRCLYVAESGASTIAAINPDNGEVLRRFDTGRHARGLALGAAGKCLLVADAGLDRLHFIDCQSGQTTHSVTTGRQPWDVAVSADGKLAVVSNLIPATAATDPCHATEVSLIDLESHQALSPVRLPTGSTNSRGVAISPDGGFAFVTHTLGRFHLPTTQLDRGWVNTNALSVIDLTKRRLAGTILLDRLMDGAADPWGVAVSPDGKSVHITLSGVHELATIDLPGLLRLLADTEAEVLANDLSILYRHQLIQRHRLPGKGPRGLNISTDGRVAVANYFTGDIAVLDGREGAACTIPLGAQPVPDAVRRGEFAYHDADQCFQRWLSCASCHPEARADGLNWDLLNDGIGNPKNARSMLYSQRTPPAMWLGVREKMETAVNAGFIHIQFSQPDPGRVEDVIEYLKALEPAPSPYLERDGSTGEAARRGREIFHRATVGCASCHSGELFTDLGRYNVGTSGPLDQGATDFDTPSLREIWRSPPYLHDGRAATLREVLTTHNPHDAHGKTSSLKPGEIEDLAAYLLSL